jgi:hypothetical protein
MTDDRQQALADFKRIMKLVVLAGVLMVVGALAYLSLTGALDATMAIAATVGVFVSVVLGCGLFAAAFFSDKSGLDEAVTYATKPQRKGARRSPAQSNHTERNAR